MSRVKRLVIAGDTHFPYVDVKALELFYKFIKDIQPDWIILTGDILDCWELSSFRKFPTIDGNSFEKELEQAKVFFRTLIRLCPKSKIAYAEGNHSFRIKRYLMERAKELYFLPSLKLENLLEFHKYPQIYFQEVKNKSRFSHNFIKFGHLQIGHADMSRKEAGATAKGLRDELGCNIITGHTHKIAMSPRTYLQGSLVGVEAGCLCQLNPDYLSNPNWQQGVVYVETNDDFTEFTIYPIMFRDYKFFFGGRIYQN